MEEIYRIKSGKLKSDDLDMSIKFAIIYDDNGVFIIDIYVDDNFDLSSIGMDKLNNNFSADCITTDSNVIKMDNLRCILMQTIEHRIKLVSYGSLTFINIDEDLKKGYDENVDNLYYVEIEGLSMSYCKINDITHEWDQTLINFIINEEYFNQKFIKNGSNTLIDFTEQMRGEKISYNEWGEIKEDYMHLLSFINGAEVKIKKEFVGYYWTQINNINKKPNSEKIISYSFTKLIDQKQNDYLPIRYGINRSVNILNKVFKNFQKYIDNKKYELNSIVYYMNNAEQSINIENEFFVKIIAFERLSSFFEDENPPLNNDNMISNDFEQFKGEIFDILNKYTIKSLGSVKSKIGDLNKIGKTDNKMLNLIESYKIVIKDEHKNLSIDDLIHLVRNGAVHKGEIKNYDYVYLLDEIIREIILKMIDYDGIRNSIYLQTNNMDKFYKQ